MTLASTCSWVFCAIGSVSVNEPASYEEIEDAADYINRSVLTRSEFEISTKWLMSEGLIECFEDRYALTVIGADLIGDISKEIFPILKRVEVNFITRGADNEHDISSN